MRALRTAALACLLAAMSIPAQASSPLAGQPAVRDKLELLNHRNALIPMVGFTAGDPYVHNMMFGVSWRYFFRSWLGVGVDAIGGFGVDSKLMHRVERALSSSGHAFQLSTTGLRFLTDATAEFVPLDGKFMLFDRFLARMDLHFQLGVGVAMISGTGRIKDTISLMPMFGVGVRIFPNKWIAVGVDVRDFIVNRVLSSRSDGSIPAARFGHNWLVSLSVSLFFPVRPGIRP